MSLTSIIPQRKRFTLEEDFNACANLTFKSRDNDAVPFTFHSNADAATYWNKKNIPILPQDLVKIFSQKEFKDFEISVIKKDDGLTGISVGNPNIGLREREYDFPNKVITKSNVYFQDCFQGKKIGSEQSYRFMELDVALGFEKMLFYASSKAGGYVSALQGNGLRDDEAFQRSKQSLSKRLLARLGALETFLPKGIYEQAQGYAMLNNPNDDLYYLAHMDHDLSKVFSIENCDFVFSMIEESFENINGSSVGYYKVKSAIHELIEFCDQKSKKLTLGKYQLMGESWHGIRDYNNDAMMARIQKHSSGFLYSHITQQNNKAAATAISMDRAV